MKHLTRITIRSLSATAALLMPASALLAQEAGQRGVLEKYTDPQQLTALSFGQRSHWLQPWRAYLDTWPASRLRNAIGINLNVTPAEADAACEHLARNGFRLARIEFGFGALRYDDPSRLTNPQAFDTIVAACKRHGLRPLFLLNSNSGQPCPMLSFTVKLTQPARKGDRTVKIDPATLKDAVPGRSGLSNLSGYWAAQALFTNIAPDGTVTLSRALPKDLPAGNAPAATLKYLPFYPPKSKETGQTPRQFEETMQGWLNYVRVIGENAKRVLGTEGKENAGFDFEVWNEMSFGSNFLTINNYYDKPVMTGTDITDAILRRTVAFVRDPQNDLPGVGIGDGFENQRPWGAGSSVPPGLTAIDKHPYTHLITFSGSNGNFNGARPVNALGATDAQAAGNVWHDTYVPSYISFFPEYFLSGIQTETLVRDLAPITTKVGNVEHGRRTRPVRDDGTEAQPPTIWITEVNMGTSGADPGKIGDFLRARGQTVVPHFTTADSDHLKAKSLLRYLCAFVNKGVSRIYFYAAKDPAPQGLGLVSGDFFKAVDANGGQYPAEDTNLTSPAMLAARRLSEAMRGELDGSARQITLERVVEPESRIQFEGNPSTVSQQQNPHPPLFNRDVLGFFPFQATSSKFVIPVYVMTRNIAEVYKQNASSDDITRFDMPQETFQLAIGNVHGSGAKVSLYDPLDGQTYPAKVLNSGSDSLTVSVAVTDSPRLLVIQENGLRAHRAKKAKSKPVAHKTKKAPKHKTKKHHAH